MARDSGAMRGETELLVPAAGPEGAEECLVTACPIDAGSDVAAGEVIVRLHSGEVDLGVKAPAAGRLALLHAQPGAKMRVGDPLAMIVHVGDARPEDPQVPDGNPVDLPRSRSADALARRGSLGVAAIVAASGLVWPLPVLMFSLLIAVLAAAARDAELRAESGGVADIVVLPLRLLRGVAARARSNGFGSLIVGTFRLGSWLALSVLLTGAVGCLAWLASDGPRGLVSAIRLAVYGYSVPTLAVIGSFSMVRRALSVGTTPAHLRRMIGWLPEGWLVVASVAGVCWIVVSAAVLPSRVWAPATSFRAVVNALPHSVSDGIHGIRASVVESEARRVVRCLAGRERAMWRAPRAYVLDDGSMLVGVRPSRARRPSRYNVATLALALQNQLTPTGVHVSILPTPGAQPLELSTFSAKRPITDPWRVLALINGEGADVLVKGRDVIADQDIDVALRCSAAAL